MGKAAALHERPGYPPNRTPKADWPARTADERRELAKQRATTFASTAVDALQPPTPPQDVRWDQPHSQSRLGGRLAKRARLRLIKEEAQDEAREQQVLLHAEAAALEAGAEVDTAADAAADEMHCKFCGTRRRLAFINGKRGRADCGCFDERRSKRRRLTGKQSDMQGLFNSVGPPAMEQ